ncbi:MAG: hypothetical protein QW045_02535 [Candidatus Micrarchaeaceae archaeon]
MAVRKATRAATRAQASSRKGKGKPKEHSNAFVWALAIIIAIAVSIYAVLSIRPYKPVDISSFKEAYTSSNSIAIYAVYSNSNASSVFACESELIAQAYSQSVKARSINLFIVANNSCLYRQYIKGSQQSITANYSILNISKCMSYSKAMPSIFIAYSPSNSIHVNGNILNVSGSSSFLAKCGIAYELT